MNKKLFYQVPIVAFILFWLIVDCIHPWTNWPRVTLHISDKQESMSESISIYKYLGNWSIFFYFTVITNIIVVVVITISWIFRIKFTKEFKMIIATYSIITAGVFWTSLAPFLPWGQNWYFDFIYIHQHSLIFIIYAFWMWDSPTKKKKSKYTWWKLFSFPLVYLLMQIIFYASIDGKVAAYPFLHFKNFFDLNLPLGWSILLGVVVTGAIAGLFALIYWLLTLANGRMKRI